MKVAHWCWIIPEPGSGPWVEPPLPSCLCQESSVLQNTTVVDLSLVCNDDRWCISHISILPRSVPDGCKPRLLAFASRWKRRPSGIGALISSAAPHRTCLDSFSFIWKSGVLNDWRLKVTNVPAFASPRPTEHLFIQQEGLFKTAVYVDDGLKVWLYLEWFTQPPHLYPQLSYYFYKCASCKCGSRSLVASVTAVSCI